MYSHPLWEDVAREAARPHLYAHAVQAGMPVHRYSAAVRAHMAGLFAGMGVRVRMLPRRLSRFLQVGWAETHFDHDGRQPGTIRAMRGFHEYRIVTERLGMNHDPARGGPQIVYGYGVEGEGQGGPFADIYGPIVLHLQYGGAFTVTGGDSMCAMPDRWRGRPITEQRAALEGVLDLYATAPTLALGAFRHAAEYNDLSCPARVHTDPQNPSELAWNWAWPGSQGCPLSYTSLSELGYYFELALRDRVTVADVARVEFESHRALGVFGPVLDGLGIPYAYRTPVRELSEEADYHGWEAV